jgi:hypothetical protein
MYTHNPPEQFSLLTSSVSGALRPESFLRTRQLSSVHYPVSIWYSNRLSLTAFQSQ